MAGNPSQDPFKALVSRLARALAYLEEFGRTEVSAVDYVNKAYREIFEAYYMVRQLPPQERKEIVERIAKALEKLREAQELISRGRREEAKKKTREAQRHTEEAGKTILRHSIRRLKERLWRKKHG